MFGMARRRARTNDFISWVERTIHLPLGLSAEPGASTLPVYLRDIAAAMIDPAVEKITLMKSARIDLLAVENDIKKDKFK